MYSVFSPVAGSRVKATPEPEVPPALPNTMRCTRHRGAHGSAMPCRRRYSMRLRARHERNTATAAASSWSSGSCGKGSPVSSRRCRGIRGQLARGVSKSSSRALAPRRRLELPRAALPRRGRRRCRARPRRTTASAGGRNPRPGADCRSCARSPRTTRVAQADVEHGVHHSRHRHRRAGAHRHQQRPALAAEGQAAGLLQCGAVRRAAIRAAGLQPCPPVGLVVAAARRGQDEGRAAPACRRAAMRAGCRP